MNIKKFLYGIAFFICVTNVKPLTVSASYLPPVSPDTSMIPSFLETVAQSQVANDTSTFLPKTDFNRLNLLVNGRSIESSMEYTYIDNSTILTHLADFYDSNGNIVPQDNTYTVYGTSDLAPFMFVADKTTGEILSQSIDGVNYHSTLVGGSDLQVSFPEFVVRDLGLSAANTTNAVLDAIEVAKQENMIVYGNTLTNSDKEFLSDYTFYFRMQTSFGWSVYVPNACSLSVLVREDSNINSYHGTVPAGNPRNIQPVIYTTDPSQVYFNGTGNAVGLKRENNSVWGTSFTYCSVYRNSYAILYNGGVLDMNLPNQSQFNQYKTISNNAVYVQPIDDLDNPNEENIYNYTSIIQNPPSYRQYVNNNYNYEGDTNYNNYPTYYSYEFPTYTDNNEYVTNIYNYYTTPQIGGDVGSVNPEDITDGIPILNNLKYRFPFSIPFDIYNLIEGLSVQREAPNFDWEIYFPVIDYTWEIDFDLSAWDSQAGIFRTCFLILFIIALAMWSYNHFFGN